LGRDNDFAKFRIHLAKSDLCIGLANIG